MGNIVNKPKWVYLVYCNKKPIVYSVYSSMRDAIKHAKMLIEYRQPIDFYHYCDFSKTKDIPKLHSLEKLIYSVCIKTAVNPEYNECIVKVERRRLL